jgi:hypothetical protein
MPYDNQGFWLVDLDAEGDLVLVRPRGHVRSGGPFPAWQCGHQYVMRSWSPPVHRRMVVRHRRHG